MMMLKRFLFPHLASTPSTSAWALTLILVPSLTMAMSTPASVEESSEATSAMPVSNTSDQCYSARGKNSVLQGSPFGGVVVVLAIDFVLWMGLLLVFSILRKVAWDYGRLALLNDNDRPIVQGRWKDYNYFAGLYKERSVRSPLSTHRSITDYESRDKGFCSWLTAVFRIKDDEIKHKCGIDAVHYLSFQRHVIVLLVIVCTLSLGVILPVNFTGDLQGKSPTNFGRTTIANLKAGDDLLWLHTIFSVLYLLITIVCMRRHARNLPYEEDEVVTRTLFIVGIPKHIKEEEIMRIHFEEAYGLKTIMDVQFCYNLERLIKVDKERTKAQKARRYYDDKTEEQMRPGPCGQLCLCKCCGFETVNALEYYTNIETRLNEEFEKEQQLVPSKPLGMAFVTFEDDKSPAQILHDYKAIRCLRKHKASRYSSQLKSLRWTVRYAPDPNSVIWENLPVQGMMWWCKVILLNSLLFLLLFFLTTPSIIVNTIDKFNVTKPVESLNSPIITQFLPTLLLWTFSALLPLLVYYSVFLECHWTRSSENRAIMHKCYFFLIFMVLILPSLGLTSINVLFRLLFDKNFMDKGSIRFECVFLPDNGAFFVNYVITAGFIGTAMELLRVPGLILYTIRLFMAKSEAERKNVKQEQAYEFQFGQAYAWMMNIFSVVMAYSITCPIIVVFGLIYILLKHMVDRYNIYFSCMPTRLNRKIHLSAVNQVVAAPILCMFWLLFYSVLRLGPQHPITLFTFAVLLIAIILCLCRVFFGYFKYLRVHKEFMEDSPTRDTADGTPITPRSPSYRASVLLPPTAPGEDSPVTSPQSYASAAELDPHPPVPAALAPLAPAISGDQNGSVGPTILPIDQDSPLLDGRETLA
uniref:CSC1-like protein 2 n=1 Tax=Myxine glutinosa TaxID=7769 RepID=UPI00358FB74F